MRDGFAFISKFSPTGALLYTYRPDNTSCGDPGDTALAIALNASGTQAYVAGISNDTLFGCIQTTPGAYKSAADVSGGIWSIKLDISQAGGASLVYGTYVGPDPNVSRLALGGVAADSQGNAYLTGWIDNQATWPTTPGAYRTTFQGGTFDAFVTKLNSTGSALVYSTYLGGSGDDAGFAIRVDSVGDAFVAGTTSSANFPHTSGFGSGSPTSFVTRLNSAGNGLIYSALVHGGSASGIGVQTASPEAGSFSGGIVRGGSNGVIALDSAGHAYVTGFTSSSGLPTANAFQSFRRGPTDAFYTNLNTTGSSLITSSYLGGGGIEAMQDGFFSGFPVATFAAAAITVDRAWNSYVVGNTTSTDFPVTSNAFQPTLKGSQAVFLTKIIIEADLGLIATASPNPVSHGTNLTYTYAVTNKGPDNSDGDMLTTTIPSGTTFQGFSTTTGTCSHPPLNGTGTFTCSRGSLLLAGHSWGPITLTVKVNAASGTTLTNTAKVSAKTQDVFQANNTKSVSVKVN